MSADEPLEGTLEETLDALAADVFDGERGRGRLRPLLARWEATVGPLRAEDPEHAQWQAVRIDWALCDAVVDGAVDDDDDDDDDDHDHDDDDDHDDDHDHDHDHDHDRDPGPRDAERPAPDTWAWRAARGEVPGVPPDAGTWAVARSVAGLWLVYGGPRPWLCNALTGIGLELSDAVGLPPPSPGAGADDPVALWDARVVVQGGAARLCRDPVAFPLAVAPVVRARGLAALADEDGAARALMAMRRRWLHWRRAPRADPALLFSS